VFKNNKPPTAADNLKNASSWSSLAQAQNPQGLNVNVAGATNTKNTIDTFQLFKKQAKEKADRVSPRLLYNGYCAS